MNFIGAFQIVSGEVFVTDPCYDKTAWCQAFLTGVKNGEWHAWIDNRDEQRPGLLRVYHEKTKHSVIALDLKWEKIDKEIGVDSGQAGVFDAKFFKDDRSVAGCKRLAKEGHAICEEEPFYSMCCDRTLGPTGKGSTQIDQGFFGGGTIPYGAISSSGYGDGGYDARMAKNDEGEIIAIEIEFLPESFEDLCPKCGDEMDEGYCKACEG